MKAVQLLTEFIDLEGFSSQYQLGLVIRGAQYAAQAQGIRHFGESCWDQQIDFFNEQGTLD